MAIYKIVQEVMEERNLKVADIAKICDLPDSTVRGIIRRKQDTVALDVAFKLSDGLGISLEVLNGTEDTIKIVPFKSNECTKKAPSQRDEAGEIAEVFRQLDDHGKGAVRAILNFEHVSAVAEQRQSAEKKPKSKAKRRSNGMVEVETFDQPAAAGLGNYLSENDSHLEQYPANVVPDGTEFGVKISGVSMAPNIPDGATAFVQSKSAIEPGQIGIFLLNGESYCKQLKVDRERREVRLVSYNPEFKDRIIEECDDFRTLGRVLGWWPK